MITDAPCGKKDCRDRATHGIKICVPCVGQALAQHRPLELFLGLVLCAKHAEEADVKEFFIERPKLLGLADPPPSNPIKDIFDHAAGAQGREADYDRAFIAPVRLDSPEWRKFTQISQTSNPQGTA